MTLRVVCMLVLVMMAPPVFAQEQAFPKSQMKSGLKPLSGDELAAEITGNTLSGIHSSGMPYSEYHAPDGRIYGHNNHEPVRDGCWAVKRDEICYTYEGGAIKGIFCWQFFRAAGGYTILLPSTGTIGTAKLEKGNPSNFDDGGQPWNCDSLLGMR